MDDIFAQIEQATGKKPISSTSQDTEQEDVFSKIQMATGKVPIAAGVVQKTPSFGSTMISDIASPLNIVARPLQAGAQALGIPNETINKYNLGGSIRPVPTDFSPYGMGNTMIKDVGSAIKGFGLVSKLPIVGGAAYGFGTSLERQGLGAVTSLQGAKELAGETVLGATAGKVGEKAIGPLIPKVAPVIEKITPAAVKTALGGAEKMATRVADWSAEREIPFAGKITKPVSEAIVRGAETTEEAINRAARTAATKTSSALAKQFPALTKGELGKEFAKKETTAFFDGINNPQDKQYYNAQQILKEAEARGISKEDIEQVLRNENIYQMDNVSVNDGKTRTTRTAADMIEDSTIKASGEDFRPLLTELDKIPNAGVPVEEAKKMMLKAVDDTPDTILSATQKKKMKDAIEKEYGMGSVEEGKTYSPTSAYDAKIQRESKVYKEGPTGTSIADKEEAIRRRIEGKVFKEIILKQVTPARRKVIEEYFKNQEKRFMTAQFLRSLDGTKVPTTLFEKARRLGIVGGSFAAGNTVAPGAGFFTAFGAMALGKQIDDMFMRLNNPLKVQLLRAIGRTEPEINQIMREMTKEEATGAAKRAKNLWNKQWRDNVRQSTAQPLLPAPQEPRAIPMPGRTGSGTPNPIGRPYTPPEAGGQGKIPGVYGSWSNAKNAIGRESNKLFNGEEKAVSGKIFEGKISQTLGEKKGNDRFVIRQISQTLNNKKIIENIELYGKLISDDGDTVKIQWKNKDGDGRILVGTYKKSDILSGL